MVDLSRKLVAPNGRGIELKNGLFIDNNFVPGSAAKISSIDPTTDSEIATVEAASAADIGKAVAAAPAAFEGEE